MTQPPLVQALFEGPLDIVGDVHGEIEPLCALMDRLGYGRDGFHPEGRRLVFVGDLTDRGPDSPAVVTLVRQLIDAGRAQCVLGNHDLNILLRHRKHDNGWFFGETFFENDKLVPQQLADDSIRTELRSFFHTLPIALEREDLRVVHAFWQDDMIQIARNSSDAESLYNKHRALIDNSFPGLDLDDVDKGLRHQNLNPVKQITSGPEERIETPVLAAGKWRSEQRVQWWTDYRGTFCVFGHYSVPETQCRGNTHAFCADYGVGKRYTERQHGIRSGFKFKLAAFRWPEQRIVFDEGRDQL